MVILDGDRETMDDREFAERPVRGRMVVSSRSDRRPQNCVVWASSIHGNVEKNVVVWVSSIAAQLQRGPTQRRGPTAEGASGLL